MTFPIPARPAAFATLATLVLVAMHAALAAPAPAPAAASMSTSASAPMPAASSAGPCRAVRLPDRGPLQAERERIARTDAALQKRSDALQLRGGTLDVTDLAAVDAYNRDVAALEADAAANDRAWDVYEDKLAKTNRVSRDAVRCGRVATGARPARTAASAASAASAPR